MGCEAAQAHAKSVTPPAYIPAPCTVRRHRAPIDPRNSMAQGQVKTSGFTYKETYDLFNQQLSLLKVSPWYIVAPARGPGRNLSKRNRVI